METGVTAIAVADRGVLVDPGETGSHPNQGKRKGRDKVCAPLSRGACRVKGEVASGPIEVTRMLGKIDYPVACSRIP